MGTVGETLRNARLAKGVTASQAALVTRIKVQTIECLENDDFSKLAAPIYCKGFIKIYAEYLGLDPAPLIDQYKTLHGSPPTPTLGKDTGGVVVHPVHESDPKAVQQEKEEWPRFEWPKLNIFRKISLPKERVPLKQLIAEEPIKFALLGLGLFVVVAFLVSGGVQCATPRAAHPAVKPKPWDASGIGRDMPAPYVDSDK